MTSPEQRERIARDVVLHGGIVIERTVDRDGHTTEVKLVDQDKFPVRAARLREDGAVEVEVDVPKGHPAAEALRAGALEHVSVAGQAPGIVRPLDGRTRVISGEEIEARRLEHVPLPARVDLSAVLPLNLPEVDDDAPVGMVRVPLNRAERRRRGQRGRR